MWLAGFRCVHISKIVDFYNYVGGETTFLSFEKNEYPMDVEGQVEDIITTKAHPASIMILTLYDLYVIGLIL